MEAVSAVDNCINVLQSYRDKSFDGIFNRVEEKLGRSVLIPRLTGRPKTTTPIKPSSGHVA